MADVILVLHALRGTSGGEGFIQRWIHAWLFWNWPPWVFNAI